METSLLYDSDIKQCVWRFKIFSKVLNKNSFEIKIITNFSNFQHIIRKSQDF